MNVQHIEQATFPGFPAAISMVEKESSIARYLRLSREYGGLIPQAMLADAMEVSKARVSQFVAEKRFRVVEIGGKNYVPADDLAHFLSTQRHNGRPAAPKARDFVSAMGGKG
jgi:hypothetical protein